MDTKIAECQTIGELAKTAELEKQYVVNELEQRIVFERKMEIFQRIRELRMENEQLGLVTDLSVTRWTPEQREGFICDYPKRRT